MGKDIDNTSTNQSTTGVAILASDKADARAKNITKKKQSLPGNLTLLNIPCPYSQCANT